MKDLLYLSKMDKMQKTSDVFKLFAWAYVHIYTTYYTIEDKFGQ